MCFNLNLKKLRENFFLMEKAVETSILNMNSFLKKIVIILISYFFLDDRDRMEVLRSWMQVSFWGVIQDDVLVPRWWLFYSSSANTLSSSSRPKFGGLVFIVVIGGYQTRPAPLSFICQAGIKAFSRHLYSRIFMSWHAQHSRITTTFL